MTRLMQEKNVLPRPNVGLFLSVTALSFLSFLRVHHREKHWLQRQLHWLCKSGEPKGLRQTKFLKGRCIILDVPTLHKTLLVQNIKSWKKGLGGICVWKQWMWKERWDTPPSYILQNMIRKAFQQKTAVNLGIFEIPEIGDLCDTWHIVYVFFENIGPEINL